MADRHRAEVVVTAAQILPRKILGDSLEGAARRRRDWRLLLQSRHEGVAAQRLAALSFGEKGAGAEVGPGVNLVVGDNEAVTFFDAADNLRDSAVVAPQVAEFFIGEDERVRHFILFHCFGI